MKARHIKKLRKKIAEFKEFTVSIPTGLFGFDGDYRCKKVIKASDEIHAIRRYFKWYYRYYKETSEFQTYYPEPCSRIWAHVLVEDSKGYKHFYR